MGRKKVYGSYQKAQCPFCGGTATTKNKIGISVCRNHVGTEGLNIKCTCGSWLDIREGKYGTFFLCENCGPISMSKAMQMKDMTEETEMKTKNPDENNYNNPPKSSYNQEEKTPKEIFITTDDVEWF